MNKCKYCILSTSNHKCIMYNHPSREKWCALAQQTLDNVIAKQNFLQAVEPAEEGDYNNESN